MTCVHIKFIQWWHIKTTKMFQIIFVAILWCDHFITLSLTSEHALSQCIPCQTIKQYYSKRLSFILSSSNHKCDLKHEQIFHSQTKLTSCSSTSTFSRQNKNILPSPAWDSSWQLVRMRQSSRSKPVGPRRSSKATYLYPLSVACWRTLRWRRSSSIRNSANTSSS